MEAVRACALGCLLAAAIGAGCSLPAEPTTPAVTPATVASSAPAPLAAARLDGDVWSVLRSSAVTAGSLYAFLPDGMLVMSSPGSRVGIGSWKRDAAGALTMVEESRPYAVDVLELTPRQLRLRGHNPGTPVEITLAPAPPPPPVPERFRGEWGAALKDCGVAGTEARLRVEADALRLHESSGQLRAVLPQGNDGLALVAQHPTGDGSTRLAYRHYRLSADGRSLRDISDGDNKGTLVRQRCPAK